MNNDALHYAVNRAAGGGGIRRISYGDRLRKGEYLGVHQEAEGQFYINEVTRWRQKDMWASFNNGIALRGDGHHTHGLPIAPQFCQQVEIVLAGVGVARYIHHN